MNLARTAPADLSSRFDVAGALAAIARSDRAALHALYEAEAPRMLGIALRVLKRRALAEEAVHDAFMRIWSHAASYDARLGSARAWIYTIVRNRALNILRGEARTELTDDMTTLDVAAEGESPEDIMGRLSDAEALHRCLKRLDDKRRDLVLLAFTQGLSHGELAARLGLPLGTVKSWIRRSLVSLKECLG